MYRICPSKISFRAPNLQIGAGAEQGVEVGEAVGVLALHLKDHWIKSPLLMQETQIEAKAFLLGLKNLRCKNEGHSTSHLTSLYAFYAAAPISRGYAKLIPVLRCKKLHVPIANITMNLVFANPTPGGTLPHGLTSAITSLVPPQKFSQSGKVLSKQYKYQISLETISM